MAVGNVSSFSGEVKAFVSEHKLLCFLTLGLAVVGFSLGKLGERVVAWLSECFGTTEKADTVGRGALLESQEDVAPPSNDESMKETILSASLPSLTEEEQFNLLIEQGVHEILPNLFLGGSDYQPQPETVHHYNGSTGCVNYHQIISATHWQPEGGFKPREEASVFRFPADPARRPPDVTMASFRMENQRYLQEAMRHIDQALSEGKRVFVHCQQGKDRSASVVIGYIMSKYNVTFEQALTFVRSKRFIAEPGKEYLDFLRDEFRRVNLSTVE